MEMDYKNLPYSQVKAEGASDCIIDLEAESTSSTIIQSWYSDITQKIHKSTHYGNEKYVDDMMIMYYRSIKEKIVDSKDKRQLKDQILTHIKYFYLYYKEIEHSLVDTNYFIRMEDILTCYCDLELEVVHNLSKHRESKKYFLFVIKKFCKVVGIYLYHNLKHILHVLLKMKYNTRNPACQMVMRKIYFHFLMSLPVEPISDEVFCRYYLAFERYKEVAKQEEKKSISEFIFLRFGKKRDFVTTNSLMKKVLTPSCDSVTNIVSHLLDSMTTRIQTYFDHLKSNEMDKMNRLNTNIDSQCGSSDFLKTYNDVLCTFSEATIDVDSNTESTSKDSDSDIEVLEEEGTIVVSDAEDIDEIVYREKDVKHRHKTKKKKVTAQQRVSDVISLDSDDDLSSTQETTPPACTIIDRLPASSSTPLASTSARSDFRMVSSENAATDTSSLLSSLSTSSVSTLSELNAESLNLPGTSSSKINTKEVSEEVPSFDKELLFTTTTEDQMSNTVSACQASLRSQPKQQSEISKLFTTPVTELPKLDLSQSNVLEAKTLSDLSVTVQKGCTEQECGINFSSPSFHKRQLPPPKVPVLFNAAPVRHRSPQRLNRVSEDITGALNNASHIMTELKLNEDKNECKKREFTSNPLFNLFPYARSVFSTQEQTPDTTQQSSVFTPSTISSACVNMLQQIYTASTVNTTTSATLSHQRKDSQAECVDVRSLGRSVSAQMSTSTSLLPVTEVESQKSQIDPLFSPTVSSVNNVMTSNNFNVITSESERTVHKESCFSETPSEPIENKSTNVPLVTTATTLLQQIDVVPLQLETSLTKQSSVEDIRVTENKLIYTPQSDIVATKSPVINKVTAIMSDLEKQLSMSSKNICDAEPLTLPRVSSAANTLLVHTLSITPIVSSQLITQKVTTSALAPISSTRDIYDKRDFLLSDERCSLESLTSCSSSIPNKQLSPQSSTLLIQVEEKDSGTSTVCSVKTAPTQHMSSALRTSPSDHVEYQTTTKIPLSSVGPWLATSTSAVSLPFQHPLLTNKNSTITEKVIPDQSKKVYLNPVIVSSFHDTSPANTLTSSVSLLNDSSWHKRSTVETSLSENSFNDQKSKNVAKENLINKQISIQPTDTCTNSTEGLRSLPVEFNNMQSTVDESPNLEALPVMESTEATKKLFQITCSTSSSDLSPANYRTDNHDSDNDLYGYNYCRNKHEASVKQLSSSESVSYKFGMITPPSDPRSDKILTDLEDSEYDNIFGAERQIEDRQTVLHADSNLENSCQDHPIVDTDVISKPVESDKFSVKDIIIQRVESVPNDDLNISFSDGEQNENSKCNSASEQDDDFFDVGQVYVKNFYLANDDLHGSHNHNDGLKEGLENILLHKAPMNASTNDLLEKEDTLLSTCVFGDNNKLEDYEENVYEGSTVSTECVYPKFEVEYRKNHSKCHEVTSDVRKNASSTTCKTSNHKTISKSKRMRSKDLKNEIKRRGTPNIDNNENIPNGDIPSFSYAEQNGNTEYNIAYQEAEDLHSERDEETASPRSVVVEETVVMPNLSPNSYKKILNKINNPFNVDVEDEEIEYETNTSSTESTGPIFDEAKKFSRNDKVVNHRTGKYKTKSKSKNVRFKDLNKTEQIDSHNVDHSNDQKVLYRSEVIRDGYNTFNLADSNIELDRILTGPIGEIKDTNNSQYYENSDGNFNLFGFANSITPIFGDMSKDLMLVDKTKDLDSPLYDELDSKDAREYMKNEFRNNCTFPVEEPLNNLGAGDGPVSIKCSVTFNDFVDTRCITPVYNKLTKIRKKKFVIRDGIKCFIDPSDERLKMETKVLVNKMSDETLLKVYKVIGHNTLRTCIKSVVVCSSTTKQVPTETKNALSKGSSYNDLHENVKEAAIKDQRTVMNGQSPPRRRRGRPRKRHFEEEEQTHPRKRRKKAQTNKSMNLYL